MQWGTFQSVLQLSVGLNTVYFSFTELRQPVISRETKLLTAIELPITERSSNPATAARAQTLRDDFTQLKIILDTIVLRAEKSDTVIRLSCLTMAVVYWVLLVFSSFKPSMKITYPEATIISLAGYVPVMLSVLMNVWAGHRVRRDVRRGRAELEKSVALGSTI